MVFNKKLFPHIVLLRLAAFIVVMLYNSYKIYQRLLIAAEENGSLFLLIVLSEKTTCCQGKICLFSLFFQEVISLDLNLSHKVFQFSCFRKGHQWASCEGIKPTEIWSHMLEVKQMLILSICKILSFFIPRRKYDHDSYICCVLQLLLIQQLLLFSGPCLIFILT